MTLGILEGQPIYDADGNELGSVKEVRGSYVKVDASMQPDYWLRTDALTTAPGSGELTVMAGAEPYSQPGPELDQETTAYGRATSSPGASASRGTQAHGGVMDEDDAQTLTLREERLRVAKEREQAGEVHLGKRLTERQETIEVPVREERVVIERTPGSGQIRPGEITDASGEIEVPLTKERVDVEKETVVAEEVGVRKEATERSERVQDTLRREELTIEEEGDLTTTERESPNVPRTAEYQREQTRRTP